MKFAKSHHYSIKGQSLKISSRVENFQCKSCSQKLLNLAIISWQDFCTKKRRAFSQTSKRPTNIQQQACVLIKPQEKRYPPPHPPLFWRGWQVGQITLHWLDIAVRQPRGRTSFLSSGATLTKEVSGY